MIQRYHLEYLGGADVAKLRDLADPSFLSSVGTGIAQITKNIIDQLSSVSADQLRQGKQHDFKVLSGH